MSAYRKFLSLVTVSVGCTALAALPNWTVTWSDATCSNGTVANDQNSYVLRVIRTSSFGGFGLQVGTATGNGVVSVDGLCYLDMRGPIMGSDLRASTPTNAVWKFSHLKANCFRPNDGVKDSAGVCTATPAQFITGLRTPGTLVSDGYAGPFHIDTSPNPKNTREIIVDEPNFTGNIGNWGLNDVGKLTNLVFRTPKAAQIVDPVCHMASQWKTDIGREWDLSGVKYIGSTSKTAAVGNGPFGMADLPGMTGVLRLPSLIHIAAGPTGSAFRGCGIGEAELGLNGNLVYLAPRSFLNCNSLTNVIIGAAPSDQTLTICTNAFQCTGLKRIYFKGEKPVFGGVHTTSSPSFGKSETPEGQITFYVKDTPSWAEVLAEADANDGWVAAETMRTAKRQKVLRYTDVTVELQDPRFADIYHESVSITYAGDSFGVSCTGAVTIAATWSDPDDAATDPRRAKFLRWEGVPRELERQNPLTFVPAKTVAIQAVFAHDWLMSETAEPDRTMENRIWRVNCYTYNATSREIATGKSESMYGKGYFWPPEGQRMGGGDLNLNGDIWDAAGTKWTLTHLGSFSPPSKSETGYKCPTADEFAATDNLKYFPSRLTLPETLTAWPGEIQNYDAYDNTTKNRWPIREIYAICPLATGGLSQFTIGGACYVERLVVRAPKVTTLGSGGIYGLFWSLTRLPRTDFSEWDLSGVTTVRNNAFNNGGGTFDIMGTLDLPKVQTIGTNAFTSLKKVTGLCLGTNALSLTSIGNSSINRMSALKSLTLGTKALTLGTLGMFENLPALAEIHFPGRVLPVETVDAILANVPEQAAEKQMTIYASPYNHWDRLAAAPTAEEETFLPDDCFGVYRAGLRKAWFVTERSPFEPKGLLLFIR